MRKTKKYSKFVSIGANRGLSELHVKKLVKSISKSNLLQTNPIIVNEKMEVIDGQHRLAAAKELRVPVYYVVVEQAGIEQVRILNSNLRNWTLRDYIDSFSRMGMHDYQILKDFIEMYGISPSTGAVLLTSDDTRPSAGKNTNIKGGEFKATNLKGAEVFANKYSQLVELLGKPPFTRTRVFILALKKVLTNDGVSWEVLLRKIKLFGHKLLPRDSLNDYLRDLEDVYNFKRRDGSITRLY